MARDAGRGRGTGIAVGIALALVVLVILWSRSRWSEEPSDEPIPRAASSAPVRRDGSASAEAEARADTPRARAPRRRLSESTDQRARPERVSDEGSESSGAAGEARLDRARVLRREAELFRRHARYPDYNERVEDGQPDPIIDARTPTMQREPGRTGQSALVVWPAKIAFVHPEIPVVFAGVLDADGQAITGTSLSATLHGGPDLALLGEVPFHDDGAVPDVTAGDGMYAAEIAVPASMVPELATHLLVRVMAEEPGAEQLHRAGTSFLVSVPTARLTGRYRDELRDGDVVVSAEVEVARPGRIHLQGVLYTMDDVPIAWSQNALEAQPGTTWMELRYHGLVFHDAGASGPYRLGTVTLTSSREMPNALDDVHEDVLVTAAYTLDQLRSEPYQDPELIERAERLELEASEAEAARAEP